MATTLAAVVVVGGGHGEDVLNVFCHDYPVQRCLSASYLLISYLRCVCVCVLAHMCDRE